MRSDPCPEIAKLNRGGDGIRVGVFGGSTFVV
jgi:hypothetical protein